MSVQVSCLFIASMSFSLASNLVLRNFSLFSPSPLIYCIHAFLDHSEDIAIPVQLLFLLLFQSKVPFTVILLMFISFSVQFGLPGISFKNFICCCYGTIMFQLSRPYFTWVTQSWYHYSVILPYLGKKLISRIIDEKHNQQ